MLSSCNEVVSAEVPNEIREIARSIENPEEFTKLTDEEAVKTLREGKTKASDKFKQFIQVENQEFNLIPLSPMLIISIKFRNMDIEVIVKLIQWFYHGEIILFLS
jgi:hypothetical protein